MRIPTFLLFFAALCLTPHLQGQASAIPSAGTVDKDDPEEIAAPIVFLCTPWAGFISGEIFNVNGGAVLVG